MQINFQGGVDDVYDACVAKGSTPASKSLSDVIDGIMAIPTGITPSGTLSITANGTYDVTNYASASVSVANTVSASRVATTTKAVNTGYTFTRSAGYAYMIACHVDNSGTVWGSFIINSAGTIQENQGGGYFSLTKNSSTSFTVKKTSGSDPMWVSVYRAL